MKRVAVDVGHLADLLAENLRLVAVDLTPLKVECAWPVFKATSIGCEPMFVKVTEPEAAERALAFLSAAERPFLPRPVLPAALEFCGHSVLCLKWKSAARVNAEDMTDGQLRSFLDGCVSLSEALAAYRGKRDTCFSEWDSARDLDQDAPNGTGMYDTPDQRTPKRGRNSCACSSWKMNGIWRKRCSRC